MAQTQTSEAPRTTGEAITLSGVAIGYGDLVVVEGVDLTVEPGEFVCLLGPSGCGKSTLLNAVAGFVPVTAGTVEAGGRSVVGPHVSRGMVFQASDALFAWLTTRQNVAFGPRMLGRSRREQAEIADRYLELVGLARHADRYPSQLSGGMRQRVQLARVLANEPQVVLMDEPFGALDAQTRLVMQTELDRIWRTTGATILFVTHDISEALLLGDRIITMTAGPAARLKGEYRVDLRHPRDLAGSAATALYRTLREDIGVEVSKTLRAQGLDEEAP